MADAYGQSKVIETPYLRIQKNCLEIMDTCIQVSNISFFSTSEIERPNLNYFACGLGLCAIGFMTFISGFTTSFWFILIGLILLAVGVLIIKAWRNETKTAKISRRLTIVTNSGNSYSIVFKNQDFLKEVVSVMTEIMRDPEHERSANINIHDCTFMDDSAALGSITEWK